MATTTRIDGWLAEAYRALSGCAEQPALEAQVLLAHILSRPRAWIIAHPESTISSAQTEQLNLLLESRRRGEPLPYLIGHWEFFGLDFTVSPAVLIPRPETELLVEEALRWIKYRGNPLRTIDVGTGSGCIAVSLAKNTPGLRILASDLSRPALEVCRSNVLRHGVHDQVRLVQADLLGPFEGPFDLVCANLPYVPTGKLAGLEVARREPVQSLDGGADGLRHIERLMAQACSHLAPDSLFLLEIEFGQKERVLDYAHQLFPMASVEVLSDLAGLPRLLRIESTRN